MVETNNANLCSRLIDAYATDIEGLTREECLGLGFNQGQCMALERYLQPRQRHLEETYSIHNIFQVANLDEELFSCLTEGNGNNALARRVQWLSDNIGNYDYNAEMREKMVQELGVVHAFGGYADYVWPALVDVLSSKHMALGIADMFVSALGALIFLPVPSMRDSFAQRFANHLGDGDVWKAAFNTIDGMYVSRPLLLAELDNENPRIRQEAALRLGYDDDPEIMEKIMSGVKEALTSEKYYLRERAAGFLGFSDHVSFDSGDRDAMPALLQIVINRNEPEDIRVEAAVALRRLGSVGDTPEVRSALFKVLEDTEDDGEVRATVARSLKIMVPADSERIDRIMDGVSYSPYRVH